MQVEKYNPNSLSVSAVRPRVQGRPDYQRCIGLYISRNSELREARGREAYEYYVAAGSSDPG